MISPHTRDEDVAGDKDAAGEGGARHWVRPQRVRGIGTWVGTWVHLKS